LSTVTLRWGIVVYCGIGDVPERALLSRAGGGGLNKRKKQLLIDEWDDIRS
jgi:hypothetical protein